MRTNEENFTTGNGRLVYEAPRVSMHTIALEYSIAAGSVQGSVTESWQTETQSQEVEW